MRTDPPTTRTKRATAKLDGKSRSLPAVPGNRFGNILIEQNASVTATVTETFHFSRRATGGRSDYCPPPDPDPPPDPLLKPLAEPDGNRRFASGTPVPFSPMIPSCPAYGPAPGVDCRVRMYFQPESAQGRREEAGEHIAPAECFGFGPVTGFRDERGELRVADGVSVDAERRDPHPRAGPSPSSGKPSAASLPIGNSPPGSATISPCTGRVAGPDRKAGTSLCCPPGAAGIQHGCGFAPPVITSLLGRSTSPVPRDTTCSCTVVTPTPRREFLEVVTKAGRPAAPSGWWLPVGNGCR